MGWEGSWVVWLMVGVGREEGGGREGREEGGLRR